jgi:ribosomal protein S18
MDQLKVVCPDCDEANDLALDRRDFIRTLGVSAAATATAALPLWAVPRAEAAPTPKSAAETAVKGLFDSLTEEQHKKICFSWDYQDKRRGLLRTFVSNNWQITPQRIRSDFYTKKQQDLIHDIFKGIINPKWYKNFLKQLSDDTGGKPWGAEQSIAIFGKPGSDKFEFVMTGRHMTIRADGNTEDHVAFGGPIFYGHAASGFTEKPNHPGNVFWPQAQLANDVYKMLEPKQQERALLAKSPQESAVAFRKAKMGFPGIACSELDEQHKKTLQKILLSLIEPYRTEDQDEVKECLKKQGGLEKCSLAFYKDEKLAEGAWDNWRLEGPAFVWYFRGYPHVHVWVNVADDPSVKLNARG